MTTDDQFEGLSHTLLGRYITGQGTDAELRQVEEWMSENPRRQRYVETFARMWALDARPQDDQKELDDIWSSIQTGIDHVPTKRTYQPFRYLGIAAAIIVAILGIKFIPAKTSSPEFKTYTTTPGQRANITLSDGSKVILAPATRLTVAGRVG